MLEGRGRGRERRGGEWRGRDEGKEWAPLFGLSLRPCTRTADVEESLLLDKR